MGSKRGLPQGLVPSDTLATVYLAELDFTMVRNGLCYTRYGDDIRMGTENYDEACLAVRSLEHGLRKPGLLINVEKTRIFRRQTYDDSTSSFDRTRREAHEQAKQTALQILRTNEGKLSEAIEESGMDQLNWDLFYHGTVDMDQAIESLRPHIKPGEVAIAESQFRLAIERQPGNRNALSREDFHQQLVASLVRLSAGKSTVAVLYIERLLWSFPDKTNELCSYLFAIASEHGTTTEIVSQVERALDNRYKTDWATAWMIRVLDKVPSQVSEPLLSKLTRLVTGTQEQWLAAGEAVKLLAARDGLDHDSFLALWNRCPAVLQTDLMVAAARSVDVPWAEAFVSSAQSNPIHEVVVRHTRQSRDR